MTRALPGAVLAAAIPAFLAGNARAGDGYHPFRDFGQNTAAPPGQTSTPSPGAPAAPTDMGAAVGRADPHPYHPFRDFNMQSEPAAKSPIATPVAPNFSGPPAQTWLDPGPPAVAREPLPDVKPWEKKDEKEQREDAAANFENVVRTFLAREAADEGCWVYREKGRTMCLTLVSVDGEHARKAGAGRYSALAVMADLRSKARRQLSFTVDFSAADWAVVDVRRPAPAKRR